MRRVPNRRMQESSISPSLRSTTLLILYQNNREQHGHIQETGEECLSSPSHAFPSPVPILKHPSAFASFASISSNLHFSQLKPAPSHPFVMFLPALTSQNNFAHPPNSSLVHLYHIDLSLQPSPTNLNSSPSSPTFPCFPFHTFTLPSHHRPS